MSIKVGTKHYWAKTVVSISITCVVVECKYTSIATIVSMTSTFEHWVARIRKVRVTRVPTTSIAIARTRSKRIYSLILIYLFYKHDCREIFKIIFNPHTYASIFCSFARAF